MPFIRTQLPSNRTGASIGRRGPGGPSRGGVGRARGDAPEGVPRRVPVLIGHKYRGEADDQKPPIFKSPRFRLPAAFRLTGVTRDSAGVPLGNCRVHLFNSADVEIAETVSDGSGNFSFTTDQNSGTYYLVAYLAGSPDRAGTSANTLTLTYTPP
jgi:hypothetical protein